MKKITLILLLFSISVSAQLHDRFPFNDSGKIIYSSIIDAEGKSKAELYTSAKEFFANTFVSAKDVIQMDDKDGGIIIGKGSKRIMIENKKVTVPVSILFSIKIECKDNKYKFEIYSIKFENSLGEFSAEDMFSEEKEKLYNQANKNSKMIVDQYRDKTVQTIDDIVLKILAIKNYDKNDW